MSWGLRPVFDWILAGMAGMIAAGIVIVVMFIVFLK